jgi:hypothetical protein
MRLISLILALSLVAAVPAALAAGSMRCGTTLVKTGDTKPQVAQKCGDPDFREFISGADERSMEQWYYERGQGQFPRVLTFRGITLIDVEVRTQ